MAGVRVLDVLHQHLQRAVLFLGGHQAQVERERLAGLRGGVIAARARLEELAVEGGLDGFGQRVGLRRIGFLSQRPRDVGQQPHVQVVEAGAGQGARLRHQALVVADAVVQDAVRRARPAASAIQRFVGS